MLWKSFCNCWLKSLELKHKEHLANFNRTRTGPLSVRIFLTAVLPEQLPHCHPTTVTVEQQRKVSPVLLYALWQLHQAEAVCENVEVCALTLSANFRYPSTSRAPLYQAKHRDKTPDTHTLRCKHKHPLSYFFTPHCTAAGPTPDYHTDKSNIELEKLSFFGLSGPLGSWFELARVGPGGSCRRTTGEHLQLAARARFGLNFGETVAKFPSLCTPCHCPTALRRKPQGSARCMNCKHSCAQLTHFV